MAVLTQVELRAGTTIRVCWVDKPIRAGQYVTLRGEDGRGAHLAWEVTQVYGRAAAGDINRGWNNNI
jgi:hypothetical protein